MFEQSQIFILDSDWRKGFIELPSSKGLELRAVCLPVPLQP
jgi:hypothetical protein